MNRGKQSVKKIRLILETYRQNVVPSILVLVIMTISLLVMTVSLGQYRLSTYTLDLLAHAGLENADYFMQELSGPGSLDEAYTQQLIENNTCNLHSRIKMLETIN